MYICTDCEYSSATKLGKCPNCGSFGTLVLDNTIAPAKKSKKLAWGSKLRQTTFIPSHFWQLDNKELQRVFPSGIKSGSTYLMAGKPGIGKSTLVLQILSLVSKNNDVKLAYFSAEESSTQIQERFMRLFPNQELVCDIFHSNDIEDIVATAANYDLIIIDSIQTISSNTVDGIAGSPSQVKQCSEQLIETCKKNNIAAIIIGHVTKGGEIAWPKYLEHLVDVVLYLEWDRQGNLRFLRCRKNRYGHTDEVAIFEMQSNGLQSPPDLHKTMQDSLTDMPGSVLAVGIDNGRPVLVNLEVLINKTNYKFPQRTAIGIDSNRLSLITAILERYLKLKLGLFDIYVNIPGEFSFRDSGLDLAIAAALYSQYKNTPINKHNVFIWEIGLWGQILQPSYYHKRIKEAEWLTIIDKQTSSSIMWLPTIL